MPINDKALEDHVSSTAKEVLHDQVNKMANSMDVSHPPS